MPAFHGFALRVGGYPLGMSLHHRPAKGLPARQAAPATPHHQAIRCVTGLLIGLLPLIANAATPAARTSPTMARAVGCLIEPDRVADIGSQVVGLIEGLHVERGDTVRAGQTLVTLRGDIERANVVVADTRSLVDAYILAAQASLDLAESRT